MNLNRVGSKKAVTLARAYLRRDGLTLNIKAHVGVDPQLSDKLIAHTHTPWDERVQTHIDR